MLSQGIYRSQGLSVLLDEYPFDLIPEHGFHGSFVTLGDRNKIGYGAEHPVALMLEYEVPDPLREPFVVRLYLVQHGKSRRALVEPFLKPVVFVAFSRLRIADGRKSRLQTVPGFGNTLLFAFVLENDTFEAYYLFGSGLSLELYFGELLLYYLSL